MNRSKRQSISAGVALIGLGLALFVLMQFRDFGQSAMFFLVGGAFLAGYFFKREFGLLIPACLVLGIGMGRLGRDSFLADYNSVLIGLGGGFLAITMFALLYERRFYSWPLIPGSALILLTLLGAGRLVPIFRDYWPLLLVVAGAAILIGALFQKETKAN